MPKWGLTKKQIESAPWSLPAHLLKPSKTVTDPVHGDIFLNGLEAALVNSAPMQRLRRVRQLGTTHLVYPGATHSRFSHALGALRAAQNLLDAVIDNRNGPRPTPDLFTEWDAEPGQDGVSPYDANLAEVTVLARAGALLHDICHVPYGHTIEDDLGILDSHDGNQQRFERLWSTLPDELLGHLQNADPQFLADLETLIISKDAVGRPKACDSLRYPFVADIVGNTICADLIDYLERDHMFTGLPASLGNRFMNDFYVSPSSEVHFPRRMVIRITRDGRARHDIATELLKYLRYRYELSERVLDHHAKLAADAMVAKLLEIWADAMWIDRASRRPAVSSLVRRHRRDIGEIRQAINVRSARTVDALDRAVTEDVEEVLLSRGDDGLLEFLLSWSTESRQDGRRKAVEKLATALLNRDLFKPIGRADDDHARGLAEALHQQFGKRSVRRVLEEDAARCAGLDHRWQVMVWLPGPRMRMKIAGVLVDQDGEINHLDRIGNRRASEIYEAHEHLWGVSVFAHRDVANNPTKRHAVLAHLGDKLGVTFRERDGQRVPTLLRLAVETTAEELGWINPQRVDELENATFALAAHRGETPTFGDLCQRARQAAKSVQ